MENIAFTTKMGRSLILGIIMMVVMVSLSSIAAAQDDAAHKYSLISVSQHDIDTWQAKVDFWRNLTATQHIGEPFIPTSILPVSQHDIDTWQAKVDFWRNLTTLQQIRELLTSTSFPPVSQHDIDTWQAKVDFYRS